MDHQPICTTRGRKPAKRAQASGSLLPLTLLVVTAVANAGSAGEASSPPRMAYQDLPEAILLPLKHEGKLAAGGGWVLSYRNGLTGTDQPEREAQSRYVTHSDRANTPTTSLISWEITRTPNNLCPEAACPDMIRIIAVPDGFIAIPESAWIEEGETLRTYIVPAGIG